MVTTSGRCHSQNTPSTVLPKTTIPIRTKMTRSDRWTAERSVRRLPQRACFANLFKFYFDLPVAISVIVEVELTVLQITEHVGLANEKHESTI